MFNTELLEPETEEIQKQEEESAGVLSSISPFRVFLAAMIGLAVVVYMFIKDFDAEEFGKIEFSSHVFFWIGMACFFMCFRHFLLYGPSEDHYGWFFYLEKMF
jgi:glycosyltransferase 2 family protein